MSANTEIRQLISRQTSDVCLLTAKEEAALVDRWVSHKDIQARNELVEAHRPMVASMAYKKAAGGALFEDLFQEGIFGLITAAEKFDPARGHRFSSYANWWILSSMQAYARKASLIVKISNSKQQRTAQRLLAAVMVRIGKEIDSATLIKIAHEADCDPATVDAIYDVMLSGGNSLNASVSRDSDSEDKVAQVIDENGECGETSILQRQKYDLVKQALTHLTDPRAGPILASRILSENPESMSALGVRFGITGERIRQIEGKALEEMKTFLLGKGLKADAFFSL